MEDTMKDDTEKKRSVGDRHHEENLALDFSRAVSRLGVYAAYDLAKATLRLRRVESGEELVLGSEFLDSLIEKGAKDIGKQCPGCETRFRSEAPGFLAAFIAGTAEILSWKMDGRIDSNVDQKWLRFLMVHGFLSPFGLGKPIGSQADFLSFIDRGRDGLSDTVEWASLRVQIQDLGGRAMIWSHDDGKPLTISAIPEELTDGRWTSLLDRVRDLGGRALIEAPQDGDPADLMVTRDPSSIGEESECVLCGDPATWRVRDRKEGDVLELCDEHFQTFDRKHTFQGEREALAVNQETTIPSSGWSARPTWRNGVPTCSGMECPSFQCKGDLLFSCAFCGDFDKPFIRREAVCPAIPIEVYEGRKIPEALQPLDPTGASVRDQCGEFIVWRNSSTNQGRVPTCPGNPQAEEVCRHCALRIWPDDEIQERLEREHAWRVINAGGEEAWGRLTANKVHPNELRVYPDGDRWCAVWAANFVNLQESDAGFGVTPQAAIEDLVGSSIANWETCEGCGIRLPFDRMSGPHGEDSVYFCRACKEEIAKPLPQDEEEKPRDLTWEEYCTKTVVNSEEVAKLPRDIRAVSKVEARDGTKEGFLEVRLPYGTTLLQVDKGAFRAVFKRDHSDDEDTGSEGKRSASAVLEATRAKPVFPLWKKYRVRDDWSTRAIEWKNIPFDISDGLTVEARPDLPQVMEVRTEDNTTYGMNLAAFDALFEIDQEVTP